MQDFFRGWKRKVGAATLVLACLLAAGWVRSVQTYDELGVPVSTSMHYFISCPGTIGWWVNDGFSSADLLRISFQTRKTSAYEQANILEQLQVSWNFDWDGIRCGNSRLHKLWMLMIPYWTIVLPMTAISAYLLFSKPPYPTPKKLPEPTAIEGA